MPGNTVCFFNSNKKWGGGEKWHAEAASNLNKEVFNIVFIAGKESELEKRVKLRDLKTISVKISNYSFLNPVKIIKISNFLRRENVKTIIINLSSDLKVAGLAAKIAGVKNIIYRRGSAIPIKNSISNRIIFQKIVTNILANSEETKNTINANKNVFPPEKIKVIYNPFDFDKYDNSDSEIIIVKEENEIIIGNAGRLSYQKGQDKFIQIARLLLKANLDFKIYIAGSGELENKLKQKVKDAGLEKKIIFMGFIKDIKSFMKSIDIFALTSIWEGFGYVLVEAMAMEKPIVAFDASSNPEIVKNLKTGFLAKDFNNDDFAKKIIKLSENQLREKMGKKGREIAIKNFSSKKIYKELETYLLKGNSKA